MFSDLFHFDDSFESSSTTWALEKRPEPGLFKVRARGEIYDSSNSNFIPLGTPYTLEWTYDNYGQTNSRGEVCTQPTYCSYAHGSRDIYDHTAFRDWKLVVHNASNATSELLQYLSNSLVLRRPGANSRRQDSVVLSVSEISPNYFENSGGFVRVTRAVFSLSAGGSGVLISPSIIYPIPEAGWDDIGASVAKARSEGVSSELSVNYEIADPQTMEIKRYTAAGTIQQLTISPIRSQQ